MIDLSKCVHEHVTWFGSCPDCDYCTNDLEGEDHALEVLMEHWEEDHGDDQA